MILGLGSYAFRWSIGHKGLNPDVPMRPEELLDIAVSLGLSVVQYADNMPLGGLSDADLRALRSKADALGITIELGTQSFDTVEVARYIDVAERLGAGILRVALDGPDAEKPIDALASEFNGLLGKAEAANLRIAVENHFNYPSPRLAELVGAISSPTVGVCLDVANSICAGEWPMETVSVLAGDAINLHLKDYVIEPDPFGVGFAIHGCPLGQGRIDSRAILDALPEREMTVIMEHWLPRCDDMAKARAKEHDWLAQSVGYARDSLGL